jgi:hypothetical protein
MAERGGKVFDSAAIKVRMKNAFFLVPFSRYLRQAS